MSIINEALLVLFVFGGIMSLLILSLGDKEDVECPNPTCTCGKHKKSTK